MKLMKLMLMIRTMMMLVTLVMVMKEKTSLRVMMEGGRLRMYMMLKDIALH